LQKYGDALYCYNSMPSWSSACKIYMTISSNLSIYTVLVTVHLQRKNALTLFVWTKRKTHSTLHCLAHLPLLHEGCCFPKCSGYADSHSQINETWLQHCRRFGVQNFPHLQILKGHHSKIYSEVLCWGSYMLQALVFILFTFIRFHRIVWLVCGRFNCQVDLGGSRMKTSRTSWWSSPGASSYTDSASLIK
jgi:hypothetical protein